MQALRIEEQDACQECICSHADGFPSRLPMHVAIDSRRKGLDHHDTGVDAPALNIPVLAWGNCAGKLLPNGTGAPPFCCEVQLLDCCIACEAPGCGPLCRALRESCAGACAVMPPVLLCSEACWWLCIPGNGLKMGAVLRTGALLSKGALGLMSCDAGRGKRLYNGRSDG